MHQANIPEYLYGTFHNHMAKRKRKLLLNRSEIRRLERALADKGRTLIPLSIYFNDGYAKCELAVATGKREWDKRQAIRERDMARDTDRELAARQRRGR